MLNASLRQGVKTGCKQDRGGGTPEMRGCSPGRPEALFLLMLLVLLGPPGLSQQLFADQPVGQLSPNWVPQSTCHKAPPDSVSVEKLLPESYKLHPFWENPRAH